MTHLVATLDEETFSRLVDLAHAARRTPEQEASHRLKAAIQQLPAAGRTIVLSAETLEALETILSGGSLLNEADLRKKVERLAGISFLHCRLPFTPNQLEALAEKAARNGLSVEQLVERTAPRIYEQFFDLVVRV